MFEKRLFQIGETRAPQNRARSEDGFSLVELLVGLTIMIEVMVVALMLFDVNSRVAKVQSQVAELQQGQRIAQDNMARIARLAGRGGVPRALALDMIDAADPDDDKIGTHKPVQDTDILTVRGVFDAPIYQVNNIDPTKFTYDDVLLNGQIVFESVSPAGIPQSLDALADAISNNHPIALLLISAVDDNVFSTVEMLAGSTVVNIPDIDGDGEQDQRATLLFSGDPALGTSHSGGSTYNASYLALSSDDGDPSTAFPNELRNVAFVGILQEYRYYVRNDVEPGTGWSPKLTRASLYPNTPEPLGSTLGNLAVDIADNVLDLQVAMAFDLDGDREILVDPDAPDEDEWRYNHEDDDPDDTVWDVGRLFNVRLTTLIRSENGDPSYMSEAIEWLENHEYDEPAWPSGEPARTHRRKVMRTMIDLRNLG